MSKHTSEPKLHLFSHTMLFLELIFLNYSQRTTCLTYLYKYGGSNQMRFAFSTNAYIFFPLTEAIRHIKNCGYEGVEILADVPHAFPKGLSPRNVIEIGKTLEQTGLFVSNINANTARGFLQTSLSAWETAIVPSLCNRDNEMRKKRIQYTKECIDLAVEWGSPCISLTSGRCLPGNPPGKAYLNFIQSLDEILDYSIKKGVCVGIEYEPGQLIESAGEVEKLLIDLPCPSLGVNFDIGHARVMGDSPEVTIKHFSHRIWNIHLEDIRGRKHYHLIPGEGDINFREIFDVLTTTGYRRFITIELYTYPDDPDDAARRALIFLEGLLN